MTVLVWPSGLFHCPDPKMTLTGATSSGGLAIDGGASQIVDTTGGGFWRVELTGIQLKSKAAILAAEAWQALVNSGSQSFILPLRQARSQTGGASPDRTIEATAYPARVTFDPTDYDQDITVSITSNQSARSNSLELTCTSSILAGKVSTKHSDDKWRIHELVVKGNVSGNNQTFEIRPPLRTAASTSDPAYMSYCFLTVTAEPNSVMIDYDTRTKSYALMSAVMLEVR